MGSSCPSSDDFSVVVLASDLGVDARTLLSNQDGEVEVKQDEDQWHDCAQYLTSDEDFSDLDCLQFFRLQGSDKSGNRIFRIVGKYFPGKLVFRLFFPLLLSCFNFSFLVFGTRLSFQLMEGVIQFLAESE